jgi:hypothetical protein
MKVNAMSSYLHHFCKIFPILAGIVCIVTATTPSYGQVIEKAVLDSVVQIITPTGTGTGFLVGIPPDKSKDQEYETFLVTNKHILGCWTPLEGNMAPFHDRITLRLYRVKPESSGPVIDVPVQLKNPDGSLDTSRVALHPDSSVDVAVVSLERRTLFQANFTGTVLIRMLTRDYFKPFQSLRDGFTDIGNVVFALGYPLGITSLLTNRPVAKAGYLAAVPGEELAFTTTWKTCDGKKEASVILRGKLLLVDGLIVPGNSGGPVLLPAGESFGQDSTSGQFQIRMTKNNRIIGIVSGTLGPSGLSVAYSSDYADELIEFLLKGTSGKPGK